jgi:tol-pal system protein YbgF
MLRVPRYSIGVVLLVGLSWIAPTCAGVFDDDEARRQILDLRKQTQTSFDTQARAQLDLSSQISALNDELARMRGLVETLNHELELARKRQQDFYVDLDTRVRSLESRGGAVAAAPASGQGSGESADGTAGSGSAAAVTPDPVQEMKVYEAALGLLRNNKLKEAITGFEHFLRDYPAATLAPNAQFWMANAWSAQGNCKKAVELHTQGLSRWPTSPKAPDTLLSLSGCQRELGLIPESRKTLESLVAKYPNTPSGEAARQRLAKK